MKKAYLVLSNGKVFEGTRIGAEGESIGELVFTTGVVGYLETLTDPAYAGQIVLQTFPLVGNYGVIEEDLQSESAVGGYVVRECCEDPSNFRAEYELDKLLKDRGICGISGIDTREVTRIIREEGLMNAAICDAVPEDLSVIKDFTASGKVGEVSCKRKYICRSVDETKFNVALIDYGVGKSVIRALCERGCCVTVFPYNAAVDDILDGGYDGIFLSGGPGDPAENPQCIETIRKLMGELPMFGIGLGHELAALAMGAIVTKLKYGHRGSNQPVRDLIGKRTYITEQNHGYAVEADSLGGAAYATLVNANDGTCEGLIYPNKRCFTVQFNPDTKSALHNTGFFYDRFIEMMGGKQ